MKKLPVSSERTQTSFHNIMDENVYVTLASEKPIFWDEKKSD